MDLQKVERMLDAYFEGETTVAEEKALQTFFLNSDVPEHWLIYKRMFAHFAESAQQQTAFQKPKTTRFKWKFSAAAVVAVLLTTFFVWQNTRPLTAKEKQEAIAAFEQTKEALKFLSEQWNHSTEKLSYIAEFSNSTDMVFKSE